MDGGAATRSLDPVEDGAATGTSNGAVWVVLRSGGVPPSTGCTGVTCAAAGAGGGEAGTAGTGTGEAVGDATESDFVSIAGPGKATGLAATDAAVTAAARRFADRDDACGLTVSVVAVEFPGTASTTAILTTVGGTTAGDPAGGVAAVGGLVGVSPGSGEFVAWLDGTGLDVSGSAGGPAGVCRGLSD